MQDKMKTISLHFGAVSHLKKSFHIPLLELVVFSPYLNAPRCLCLALKEKLFQDSLARCPRINNSRANPKEVVFFISWIIIQGHGTLEKSMGSCSPVHTSTLPTRPLVLLALLDRWSLQMEVGVRCQSTSTPQKRSFVCLSQPMLCICTIEMVPAAWLDIWDNEVTSHHQ